MSLGNPISTISGQTSAGQYGFVDPNNTTGALQNSLYGAGGAVAGGPMGTYNQNANGILGQVAGLSGPLQNTLSGIANYQATNAANAVGSTFANQGALGSGAGAQAFGQALANPFAQAQAQLQQGQLQAGSGALNSLMGISGGAYNSGLNNASNLMEHSSGLVAPTNYTNPNYTMASGVLNNLASAGKNSGPSMASALSSGKGSTAGAGALGASSAGGGAVAGGNVAPWFM